MKRIVIILTILVLTSGVGFLLLVRIRKTGSFVQTQSTFLGFTNKVPGAPATNALFGFDRIPVEDTLWSVVEISQWDGTNFHPRTPLPNTSFEWIAVPNVTNHVLYGTVPVISTSVRTRVVIKLTPSPDNSGRGWKRFIGQLKSWSERNRLGIFAQPRGYRMTNEFNPAEPVPQAGR